MTDVGDFVTLDLSDYGIDLRGRRAAAVVVEMPCAPYDYKVAFLDPAVVVVLIADHMTAYGDNRGWFISPGDGMEYDAQPYEPTDLEGAMGMRILLTGYRPGLDDD